MILYLIRPRLRRILHGGRLHHLCRRREGVRRLTVSKQRLDHRTVGRRGRGNASLGRIVCIILFVVITGGSACVSTAAVVVVVFHLCIMIIYIVVIIIVKVHGSRELIVIVGITSVVIVMVGHLLWCPWYKVAIRRGLVSIVGKVVGAPKVRSMWRVTRMLWCIHVLGVGTGCTIHIARVVH